MLPFKVAFPPKYWQVQQYLLAFEIELIIFLFLAYIIFQLNHKI